jgi:choice-of-anchor B domain-containing protein
MCGGGLHMVDVRDPLHPKFAGCFSDPQTGRQGTGYTHDAQCVVYHGPMTKYQGRQICFGWNETHLSIADVTDKSRPVAISRATYPNVGYAHQGWLTDDQRYMYENDELDEIQGFVDGTRTLIWDVSDLENPVLAGQFISENKATDHNLWIVGNTMYQSNYMAGLRVLDITDRLKPKVVGYFDTYPVGEDVPGFEGTWGNYPFFKSGVVAVTSGTEGLFVLKKRPTSPVP